MVFRSIARYIALTMAVLGGLGMTQAAQSPSTVPAYLVILVVGLATVYGLKSPDLRIIAAILNCVVVGIGLYLILVTPEGMLAPEIRRLIGGFCLIGGGIDAIALFTPEPMK